MSEILKPYTIEECEVAAAAAPAQGPEPAGRPVKAVQADLFNEQGSLFGHVTQPGELK